MVLRTMSSPLFSSQEISLPSGLSSTATSEKMPEIHSYKALMRSTQLTGKPVEGGLGLPFNTPIPERSQSSPRRRRCTAADPPAGGVSTHVRSAAPWRRLGLDPLRWTRPRGPKGRPGARRERGRTGARLARLPPPGMEQGAFSSEDGGATKGGEAKAGSRAKGALGAQREAPPAGF